MEKLTDTTRIHALLQRLIDHRALLAVTLDEGETTYTTALVEINTKDGHLILDEFKPDGAETMLEKSPIIKARAQADGVVMSFISKISEVGSQDNIPYYKAPIPQVLGYLQRRQNVRIRVGAAHDLSASLSYSDGTTCNGHLEDISLGGLRINFKKSIPPSFQKGEQTLCSFELIGDRRETLNCEVVIRVIKNNSDRYGPAFIGAEFVELDRQAERQLQRLIMDLQRDLQQRRNT